MGERGIRLEISVIQLQPRRGFYKTSAPKKVSYNMLETTLSSRPCLCAADVAEDAVDLAGAGGQRDGDGEGNLRTEMVMDAAART